MLEMLRCNGNFTLRQMDNEMYQPGPTYDYFRSDTAHCFERNFSDIQLKCNIEYKYLHVCLRKFFIDTKHTFLLSIHY
jgi:hypothetical protein